MRLRPCATVVLESNALGAHGWPRVVEYLQVVALSTMPSTTSLTFVTRKTSTHLVPARGRVAVEAFGDETDTISQVIGLLRPSFVSNNHVCVTSLPISVVLMADNLATKPTTILFWDLAMSDGAGLQNIQDAFLTLCAGKRRRSWSICSMERSTGRIRSFDKFQFCWSPAPRNN